MGMDIELVSNSASNSLEIAASGDVTSFQLAVDSGKVSIDEVDLWYTRRIGSNQMAYEERTPLMVAAQYGSTQIVDFILQSGGVDVNRVSGSDRVTALHCAVAGGSHSSGAVVQRLISASANINIIDANGTNSSLVTF